MCTGRGVMSHSAPVRYESGLRPYTDDSVLVDNLPTERGIYGHRRSTFGVEAHGVRSVTRASGTTTDVLF